MSRRRNEFLVSHGSASAFTFDNIYFCSTKNITYADNSLHMCRTRATRDMLSFIAGFLVVFELVFAGRVGEIKIR